MNVRIFWVRAMKCMCAQTRPRFILSSEGVLGGMEFEPMLTPREKSPLPENVPGGGSNPRRCGQRAQALPTELFRPPALGLTRVLHPLSVLYHRTDYSDTINRGGWCNKRDNMFCLHSLETLLDESINRVPASAGMHLISWTQEIPTFIS